MKKAVIAAATAATLWSGIALAQDDASSDQVQDQQGQIQTDQDGNVQSLPTSQTPQDSWRDRTLPDQQTGVGGSGPAAVVNPSQVKNLNCNCREVSTGTGGSGNAYPSSQDKNLDCSCREMAPGTGGSGAAYPAQPQDQYAPQPEQRPGEVAPHDRYNEDLYGRDETRQNVDENQPGTGGSGDTVVVSEGETGGPDLNGVSVLLGGGLEGFTGSLAPRLAVGPTYGAALQIRPTDIIGLEFAYSGGVHEIKDRVTNGNNPASGADIVRNGARAMATVGLLDSMVQPYILGGVGVDWWTARGNSTAYGFRDDTSGEIPVGLGLRTQVAGFTADLRGLYNVPFDQNFAPGTSTNTTDVGVGNVNTENNGRYQATLSIGANF
jgi:hypothetical protein